MDSHQRSLLNISRSSYNGLAVELSFRKTSLLSREWPVQAGNTHGSLTELIFYAHLITDQVLIQTTLNEEVECLLILLFITVFPLSLALPCDHTQQSSTTIVECELSRLFSRSLCLIGHSHVMCDVVGGWWKKNILLCAKRMDGTC